MLRRLSLLPLCFLLVVTAGCKEEGGSANTSGTEDTDPTMMNTMKTAR